MISCINRRLVVVTILTLLASASVSRAQEWVGTADATWGNLNNWNPNTVPDAPGAIVTFDNAGNGNTNISLGGSRALNLLQFNGGAAAYNLGVLNSGDTLNFDAGGQIIVDAAVANLQTINAAIATNGDLNLIVANSSLPSSNLGLKLEGGVNLTGFMNLSGAFAGALTIDQPITGASGILSSTITTGSLNLNAQSTYGGGTFFNSTGSGQQGAIRLGVDTVGTPGAITSGPLGTGIITTQSGNPAVFQPVGGDRTIANDWNFVNAIFVGSIATAPLVDPTPHNLTLTGAVNLGSTGRVLTNNLPAGVSLNFGSATVTSNLTLSSVLSFQTQTAISGLTGGGKTVINDPIVNGSGTGGITVQNSAIVVMNNANNTYTGVTTVTGTGGNPGNTSPSPALYINGVKSGAGAVNVNTRCNTSANADVACTGATAATLRGIGLLGGIGSIAGTVTNQGILSPGTAAGAIGTLTFTGNVSNASNPATTGGALTGVAFSSHWAIDLSGATADKIVVGGNLSLSGIDILDVTGTGNAATTFTIATYTGTLTGTFDTLNIPSGYTINYGTGTNSSITLTSPAAGLPGDFNSDGKVDAGDYVTWRKNNGTSNALANDNGLGTPIGVAHYNLWRANFGNPPGAGAGGLSNGAVPEPASMLLIFLSIAGFPVVRARRRATA